MSNLNNENLHNFENEDELDYWEIFQSETDDTRNLLLDYLVKKCENHSIENFKKIDNFENLEENIKSNYHFENCNKYLFESERRRKPFINGKLLYYHDPCIEIKENSKCIKGDICPFSHNQLEIKFHPTNYRKDICKSVDCDKHKKYCYNSHRTQDMRYFPLNKKIFISKNTSNKNENNISEIKNNNHNSNNNNMNNYNCKIIENINNEVLKNSKNNKNSMNEKENMLNKLNLDIKNLLDEFDLDQINCDGYENEDIDNTDDKTDKKLSENKEKSTKTYSTNSKKLENSDNDLFQHFNDNNSNSTSSVINLRKNLLNAPNKKDLQISNPSKLENYNETNFSNFNNSKNNISPNDHSPNRSNLNSFSNVNLEKELLNQKFDLQTFKTIKCIVMIKHNEKHCIYFHSNKDRRRQLIKYSSDTCKFGSVDKNCPDSDFCLFSHNKVEMFYHPDRFKTKFCSQYGSDSKNFSKKNLQNCAYGKYCSFAHSEEEIKIELIHKFKFDEEFFLNHFKTIVCPFTHDHDKATCVYSHNWQDYRRNPKKFTYRNVPCQIWDIKKTILNYRDGCPKESSCILCHGWKEEDFHPLNYKTKKCKNFNKRCEKNIYCPFFHSLEEKRKIPLKIKQEYEMRLENKVNNQKYSNLMNDSFNMNRSNSVKSNLSDNVSYNHQNRRMNYNLNGNSPNNNLNYENINQINNFNLNNNINSNHQRDNVINKNTNNFNTHQNNPNLNFHHSPVYSFHQNNSMNLSNYNNNMNFMLNNSNNNIQNYNSYKFNLNNQQPQQKYSFNSVNNVPNLDKNLNKQNHSGNLINNNNNNIWGFPNQFPNHNNNNFSPNNSFGKSSFSDNEMQENQFLNFNNSRNNKCKSFSSHFSNSDSDQLNESFKIEKDYEMILGNPDDDSIDMNDCENSNNFNKNFIYNGANNEQKYGKNDNYCIEKIEETNNLLKELIREGERNINFENSEKNFENEENLNKENFLEFLKIHKFNNLFNLINLGKISLKELVKFSDAKIIDLIEPENRFKSNKLINVLMKFDEKIEGDDVMECLNNLNFQQ